MKVLLLSSLALAKDQAILSQKVIARLAPRHRLSFLFAQALTPKRIEMLVKEKRITEIIFDGVPEQTVRTTVNYVQKKFPSKKFNFFSTDPLLEEITGVRRITQHSEIDSEQQNLQVA